MQIRPDILVLGGGGVAGEAWMTGVLAGLSDGSGFDLSGCEYFVGTSAGSAVAARLAVGGSLRRPADVVEPASAQGVSPNRFTSLVTPLAAIPANIGLQATAGIHAVSRRLMLAAAPNGTGAVGELVEGWDVADGRFDGRLRVVAVERRSGRRVVFGSPGAPDASVREAVAASCTVPWLFEPTVIDGVEYLDGGVWSSTNIDITPNARGAEVLCLAPRASFHGPLSPAVRAFVRSAASVEAAALRGRGAHLRLVAPDRASAGAMGRDFMAREPAASILAAGYAQGLAL